jgi:hypothetical protein
MEVPYLSFFNLKEEPFSTVPNPRFPSPIHSTALGNTEFTVQAKKGLALIRHRRQLHGSSRAKFAVPTMIGESLEAPEEVCSYASGSSRASTTLLARIFLIEHAIRQQNESA